MTDKQPEALRLADAPDQYREWSLEDVSRICALLRTQARADLEAENKRLREAIQKQLDPSWECNSNHPALYAALEKQHD